MWFEKYRDPLALANGGLASVGLYFGAVVMTGGSPVAPDLYGEEVYAIPAMFWAATQAVSAGGAMFGAICGGRFGAFVTALGAIGCIFIFSIFCAFSSRHGQGTIVFAGNLFLCLPIAWVTLISAIGYLKGGRDGR